jgi:hypothetical protein
MENLKELTRDEALKINGGEDTLWQKFCSWAWDEMFPPAHDHNTCGLEALPNGMHLVGTGVDR